MPAGERQGSIQSGPRREDCGTPKLMAEQIRSRLVAEAASAGHSQREIATAAGLSISKVRELSVSSR